MGFILKVIAGALGTALAVWIVPGITLTPTDRQEQILTLLGVSLILGLVNAFVRPFAQVAGFCLIILTLGAFLLVINAGMLMLVSSISGELGLGFHVDGFWPALLGSVIISLTSAGVGAAFSHEG